MSYNSRGVTLAFWPKKLPKMAILRDKLKDFEKSKRGEAMKSYFLHSPGQDEQFKLYFTPLLKAFEKFCSTPCYYTPYY